MASYVNGSDIEVGEYTVTATWEHEDDAIVTLTIGGEQIETTPWHLFYTPDGWMEAGDLAIGDEIYSLDGTTGTVEGVLVEDRTQTMYDLTVEEVHTFAVGDGNWVVHNCDDFPDAGEIGTWEGRVTKANVGINRGLYEYRSWGEPDGAWYVGESHDQSMIARLRGKKGSFGRNWDNVTFTPIEFANEQAALVAERVRLEQLWVSEGIDNVVLNNPARLANTASRRQALEFMNAGLYRNSPRWPSWLRLPDQMVPNPE
jgi:hypothetical protein